MGSTKYLKGDKILRLSGVSFFINLIDDFSYTLKNDDLSLSLDDSGSIKLLETGKSTLSNSFTFVSSEDLSLPPIKKLNLTINNNLLIDKINYIKVKNTGLNPLEISYFRVPKEENFTQGEISVQNEFMLYLTGSAKPSDANSFMRINGVRDYTIKFDKLALSQDPNYPREYHDYISKQNRIFGACSDLGVCGMHGFCYIDLDKSLQEEEQYRCHCDAGYSGRNCEVDLCAASRNPCPSGLICQGMGTGYICRSPEEGELNECPEGSFDHDNNMNTECKDCPVGKTCKSGTKGFSYKNDKVFISDKTEINNEIISSKFSSKDNADEIFKKCILPCMDASNNSCIGFKIKTIKGRRKTNYSCEFYKKKINASAPFIETSTGGSLYFAEFQDKLPVSCDGDGCLVQEKLKGDSCDLVEHLSSVDEIKFVKNKKSFLDHFLVSVLMVFLEKTALKTSENVKIIYVTLEEQTNV